jgi:photosystem II stability/assembly factor-like uncharacterized protein
VRKAVVASEVRDAQLVTSTIGWALSNSLFRTSDAGASWSDVSPAGVDLGRVRAVYFSDPAHGWVLATRDGGESGAALVVYRTPDGGSSWGAADVGAASAANLDSESAPASFDFVDARHGWLSVTLTSSAAFSRGELYSTSDGGATWKRLAIPIGAPVEFLNDSDGWTAGGASAEDLYVTHDGGATWSRAGVTPPPGQEKASLGYSVPSFVDGRVGALPVTIIDDASAELAWYRTTDRGASWQLTRRFEIGQRLETGVAAPTALSPDGGWIGALGGGRRIGTVTQGGAISTERDARGLPLSENAAVVKLTYGSTSAGWAIVRGSSCAGFKTGCTDYDALFRTADGGSTWTEIQPS